MLSFSVSTLFFSFLVYNLCISLRVHFGINEVLVSSFVGFIFSFIPKNRYFNYQDARMISYSSSFAAMLSLSKIQNSFSFLVVPLLVWLFYHLMYSRFKGFGGKLGTIAFFSVVSYLVLGLVI